MFIKSSLTADVASAATQFMTRHRLAALLSIGILGLIALAPVGAQACGQLPPGVEPTGPVLRGAVAPKMAQPVITPACGVNSAPGVAANASAETPTKPDAGSAGPAGRVD